ncbi:MAG: hypothetical protein R3Y22_04325 [Bacteroidales bacterium]
MKRHLFYLAALVIISMSSCDNPTLNTMDGGIDFYVQDFVNTVINDETGETTIYSTEYGINILSSYTTNTSTISLGIKDLSIPTVSLRDFSTDHTSFAIENDTYCFDFDTINIAGVIFTDFKCQTSRLASYIEFKSAAGYTLYATSTDNAFGNAEISITNKLEPEAESYEYNPTGFSIDLDIETMTASIEIYSLKTSADGTEIDIYLNDLDLEVKGSKFTITADNATVETVQEGITLPEITNLYAELEGNQATFSLDYNDSYTVTGSGTPK